MAVTDAQLAVALRIIVNESDTIPAGQLAQITRLGGVADAMIEVIVPGAPDAVKDEIKVRVTGYLFDAPSSARGDFYGNAWKNSGAAGLATRWVDRSFGAGSPDAPDTGADLTGEEIALLIDGYLGNQDWRTGGTVANVPAASATVRGGVLGITNNVIDADTSTGWFAWQISHVKRLINRIVPAWARGTGHVPPENLGSGAASARYLTLSSSGGVLAGHWGQINVDRFWYGPDDPATTLNAVYTHYLKTSNPGEWWIRDADRVNWTRVYTFSTSSPALQDLLDVLETAPGAGSGRVFTLDGQGKDPSWQPPQGGGVSNLALQQAITAHAAEAGAHHAPPPTWVSDDNVKIPSAQQGADAAATDTTGYLLNREHNGSVSKWLGLNALMQKSSIREQVQDLVAAMFTGNSAYTYDDTAGTITTTFPNASTSGNTWVLKFFRPGSAPTKIIAERVGHINTAGRFIPWTGIVNYVGAGANDWTIAVNNAADFNSHFAGDLRFAASSGGVSDYDDLTDKPLTRVSELSAIPQPTSATNGHRYQTNNGELYRVEDVIVAGTDRAVPVRYFPVNESGVFTGVRFQGVVDNFSDLPANTVVEDEGKWWMVRHTIDRGESPFIIIDSLGSKQSIAHSPDTDHPYVGAWQDLNAAKNSHEITAAGQLFIAPQNPPTDLRYTVYEVQTGFVAGTPDHHTFGIVRQDVTSELLRRISDIESRTTQVRQYQSVTYGGNVSQNNKIIETGAVMIRNTDLLVQIGDVGSTPTSLTAARLVKIPRGGYFHIAWEDWDALTERVIGSDEDAITDWDKFPNALTTSRAGAQGGHELIFKGPGNKICTYIGTSSARYKRLTLVRLPVL